MKKLILCVLFIVMCIATTSFGYTTVRLGPEYFPETSRGRPIALGSIYVGQPDLDPEIVGNQKTLSVQQEDGTIVAVTQPIYTNAGGVPVYSGSPVTLLVEGTYSLKILDSSDAQVYYVPSTTSDGIAQDNCYPSYAAVDQGATGDNNTLKYCIDTIGADQATIVLRHNSGAATTTYTLTTAETIPANVTLKVERGAIIDGAGTLTINGSLESGLYQVFGASITVTGLNISYPEWWGDTSAAIISALNSSSIVKVSKDYSVLSTILIPSNRSIIFEEGAALTAKTNLNTPILQNLDIVGGNTDIYVTGGVFDGNSANQTTSSALILFKFVTGGKLDQVKCSDALATFDGDSYANIWIEESHNIDVINCESHDSVNGGGLTITVDSSEIQVLGGEFNNNGDSGVTTWASDRITVSGVVVEGSVGSCISLNSTNSIVSNCIVSGSTLQNGITVGHDTADGNASGSVVTGCVSSGNGLVGIYAGGNTTENITIVGNRCFDNTDTGIQVSGGLSGSHVVTGNNVADNIVAGISITADSVTVTGNVAVGNGSAGILLTNADDNIVTGNVCKNNGATIPNGIRLNGTSTRNLISSNRCYDDQTPKVQTSGITDVSAGGNTIIGNMVEGNDTFGISGAGITADILSGNVLDSTALMTATVALTSAGTSTEYVNANIRATGNVSVVTVLPLSADAWARTPFVSAINDGSVSIGHTNVANTPNVLVIIH